MGRNSSEGPDGFFDSSAAFRATLSAPLDDEPVTRGDAGAIERSNQDVQAGRVVSHDEILREFGVQPQGTV